MDQRGRRGPGGAGEGHHDHDSGFPLRQGAGARPAPLHHGPLGRGGGLRQGVLRADSDHEHP